MAFVVSGSPEAPAGSSVASIPGVPPGDDSMDFLHRLPPDGSKGVALPGWDDLMRRWGPVEGAEVARRLGVTPPVAATGYGPPVTQPGYGRSAGGGF